MITLPDHLKPIEPAAAVHAVCERIATRHLGTKCGIAAAFYAFIKLLGISPADGAVMMLHSRNGGR
jgi:hypothetical protein